MLHQGAVAESWISCGTARCSDEHCVSFLVWFFSAFVGTVCGETTSNNYEKNCEKMLRRNDFHCFPIGLVWLGEEKWEGG